MRTSPLSQHGGSRERMTAAIALLALVSLTACTPAADLSNAATEAAPSGAGAPSPEGLVAFGASTTGEPDIMTIALDGSGRTSVTDDPAFDACPAFTPDGSTILFCSDRSGTYQVWAIGADGSDPRQVTDIGSALFPDVSPDGSLVAFCGLADGEPEETEDLWVVGIDGSDPHPISDTPGGFDCYPSWSPDGSMLAFVSDRSGSPQLWLAAADGSDPHALTTDAVDVTQVPDWSPDGRTIAYAAAGDVWLIEADGTDPHAITADDVLEFSPAWTGDGSAIVYRKAADDLTELWIMAADGSGARVLSAEPAENAFKPTVSW
ncbi:hypothetical protein WDJ51_04855 [Rathayibacter sp. YIM 133350]|uniref:TolB family protein n=1 Tax=Rathayibacter sp. YIM 133350 TaxID=3131992 RepID=UPI00307D934F